MMIASGGVVAIVCAILLHSHLDRPTHLALGAVALLYMTLVMTGIVRHLCFVRSLQPFTFDGELGGVQVRYVRGVAPFVAGILRPRVYCDPGLVRRLTPSQQRAVALHEHHHRVRRDPLRLQLSRALRPLARLLPALHPYLDSHEARYEIAADRYALDNGATRADIAGALLAMLQDDRLQLSPGFVSIAELRLQALHDDAVVYRPNPPAMTSTLAAAACTMIACVILL